MKIDRCGQAEPYTKADYLRVAAELGGKSRLILALAWYTCERPGALLQLQVSDIYEDSARRVPRSMLVIPARLRKDGKTREVTIARALRHELRAYDPPLSGYLFPGRDGGHLTLRAYSIALAKIHAILGMRGYSAYSARRGSITTLARSGLGVRELQQLTGHSSAASLLRYIEPDRAAAAAALELL